MNRRGLSQEGLKLLACLTMLLDHTAAVLVQDYTLYIWMRTIGRIAFPIYCWMLAEGSIHTRSPGKYALRLAIGAALSELPFDCALFGGPTWSHQSVMLTLLLGYGALYAMDRCPRVWAKPLLILPFALAADLLLTDYGGHGVLLIGLLALSRPLGLWVQALAVALMCWWMPSMDITVLGISFPMELAGVLAMVPIACHHGRKRTRSRALQWGFYLFYPVHLAVIWWICVH